jgi:hypothetical protein
MRVGSLPPEPVKERARERAELIELLGAEPVNYELPDMFSVEGHGGVERSATRRGNRDVYGSTFTAGAADKSAFAHAGQLMVQSALFPPEVLAQLNRTEPVTVRFGEDGKQRVVGV